MHGAVTQLQSGELDGAAAAVELASLSHGLNAMIEITNDLLDVEALRAGKLRIQSAAVNLREVLDRLARVAGRGGTHVTLQVAPDVPELLEVDSLRFGQASIACVVHVDARARITEEYVFPLYGCQSFVAMCLA